MTEAILNRRHLLLGAAGLACASIARADETALSSDGHSLKFVLGPSLQRLRGLEDQARIMGLPQAGKAGGRSLGPSVPPGDDDFTDLAVRYLDLMDRAGTPAARSVAGTRAAALRAEAGAQLIALHRSEVAAQRDALSARLTFRFDDVARGEYRSLFDDAVIRPGQGTSVSRMGNKLLAPERRTAYEAVQARTGVPWYVVGILHALETSLNLNAHIHNGDPLGQRTRLVPANRPAVWNPPSDWVSSAVDAMIYDKLAGQTDWSLEHTLYRMERYNGIGSRRNGINTPYLWSFSQHYTKGKFVADGVWDAEAVSKQVGAAVLLKWLILDEAAFLPGMDSF